MALCLSTGDTETTAMELRQLVDHMTRNSQRLLGAMVLDRWDSQEWGLL